MADKKNKNSNVTEQELELLKKKVELLEKEVELKQKEAEQADPEAVKSSEKKETDEELYKKSVTIYEWDAPTRIFKKRDRRWYVSIGVITLILVFFLVLVDKPLLIAVLLAAIFLVFVLSTIEPEVVTHEILNRGVYSFKKLYKWKDLKSYWFVKKGGKRVLYIDAKKNLIPRLILIVGEGSVKEINNHLQKHLPYQYVEDQNRYSKYLDGLYIPADEVPGNKPDTNKGSE